MRSEYQSKWQQLGKVAGRVAARHLPPEEDASEQTGSNLVLNCSVQTPDGIKAVHGFWLHGAGAHVARLRADPVAVASIEPGRTLIDREAGVFRIKRVALSPCGAWLVATCQRLL